MHAYPSHHPAVRLTHNNLTMLYITIVQHVCAWGHVDQVSARARLQSSTHGCRVHRHTTVVWSSPHKPVASKTLRHYETVHHWTALRAWDPSHPANIWNGDWLQHLKPIIMLNIVRLTSPEPHSNLISIHTRLLNHVNAHSDMLRGRFNVAETKLGIPNCFRHITQEFTFPATH